MLTPFLFLGQQPPSGSRPPHYRGYKITLRNTTLSTTPLDEWSARRRDLYLTTHNTQERQTSTPPTGFEPTISAGERPQTHTLDSATTRTDLFIALVTKITRVFRCTVTSVSCIRYQWSTPRQENPLGVFFRTFGATASRVFARKLWSALVSVPQLCRQKYTKLGIVWNVKPRRLAEKKISLPQWTAASHLQLSSRTVSKLRLNLLAPTTVRAHINP